ncbi:UNVERIFIED_CONTAM: hypothetical protein FKN15_044344 [Acipenser sinensis]
MLCALGSLRLGLAALCLLSLLPAVSGHIWAWMLSIPYSPPGEGAPVREAHPSTSTGKSALVLCGRVKSRAIQILWTNGSSRFPRAGARCKLDRDCGGSMCCARHHGEMICKRRLALSESCFVPDGGLAFSINQICPCEEGLLCRNSAVTPNRE